MSYEIVQPPSSLKFDEMSKIDLKSYFDWFVKFMPIRLKQLIDEVRQTPSFDDWSADKTPASLEKLGCWFASQVETRRRSASEMANIKAGMSFSIVIPQIELTRRTFSIAFDIGIYFAQVFSENHSNLMWYQSLKNKKDIDYGQPVLVPFGRLSLNPIRLLVTLSYGIADGKKNSEDLKKLYDTWKQMI